MQKMSMKIWSSDAVLGAPENAPYRWKIPQLGLKFEGKKTSHNLWALFRKSRKKSVKKWNSDAVLGAPDSTNYGREIPHIGFRFQKIKWHIRVLPSEIMPSQKWKWKKARNGKKSGKDLYFGLRPKSYESRSFPRLDLLTNLLHGPPSSKTVVETQKPWRDHGQGSFYPSSPFFPTICC